MRCMRIPNCAARNFGHMAASPTPAWLGTNECLSLAAVLNDVLVQKIAVHRQALHSCVWSWRCIRHRLRLSKNPRGLCSISMNWFTVELRWCVFISDWPTPTRRCAWVFTGATHPGSSVCPSRTLHFPWSLLDEVLPDSWNRVSRMETV